ncbi:hypothetical protein E2C01_078409 [Portunus trituberculatus]|uniref:Uncharacterized protein n=1 Tax=Portunus trituberculatus TaxID=210409 RepID=A0A5B7IU26_PORTR|nr:hypothetical protein [Portunus trituberculatus]
MNTIFLEPRSLLTPRSLPPPIPNLPAPPQPAPSSAPSSSTPAHFTMLYPAQPDTCPLLSTPPPVTCSPLQHSFTSNSASLFYVINSHNGRL